MAILMHKIEQNGRVYAFEFDGRGGLLTVEKIALTNDAKIGVAREYAVLLKLDSAVLPFQVPRVVNFRDSKQACMLCVSAADSGLSIHDKSKGLPDLLFDAIASLRPMDFPAVLPRSTFEWFDVSLERVTNPVIRRVAREITSDHMFAVCAAHCDLGSENVFSNAEVQPENPKFAVIDWELFTETAPAMTDRVGFWLGQHHRKFKREIGAWDSKVAASHFLNTFRDAPGGIAAATLALLGLLNMGNDLAERLCGVTK
ncbi:hypothetical protein MKP05_20280 [Halomonas sp. EGI 63088]|uniref:Aminoglycoside phosphotransferase domain-containing protein n=1 Tax=Halomonas flagellata TaxID=2920385 RepID=A0ABS9S041_9GAMM|nr:hypothetical protein [Halomonas flagellata]MCH4565441.1 hypothetical protein [Halomonas flagellata]